MSHEITSPPRPVLCNESISNTKSRVTALPHTPRGWQSRIISENLEHVGGQLDICSWKKSARNHAFTKPLLVHSKKAGHVFTNPCYITIATVLKLSIDSIDVTVVVSKSHAWLRPILQLLQIIGKNIVVNKYILRKSVTKFADHKSSSNPNNHIVRKPQTKANFHIYQILFIYIYNCKIKSLSHESITTYQMFLLT